MKTTGTLRKIDSTGRVSLPIALREMAGISPHDEIEITLNDNQLILEKCNKDKTCCITGETSEKNIFVDGKCFSETAIRKILSIASEKNLIK